MAVVEPRKKIIDELRARAAMFSDVDVDRVVWEESNGLPALIPPPNRLARTVRLPLESRAGAMEAM
jgi:hypothetical protein